MSTKRRTIIDRSASTDRLQTNELALTANDELIISDGLQTLVSDRVRSVAVRNEKLHLWRTGGKPWTIDPTFDNTAAFNAAMTMAAGAAGGGGGDVDLGPHIWPIAGVCIVPHKVNLVGPGGGTYGVSGQFLGGLRAINSNAQLRFGNLVSTAGSNRGGFSGGFSVNGGGISNRSDGLVAFGDRTSSEFASIHVTDCVSNGIFVVGTQNSSFDLISVNRVGGDGVTFDTYALCLLWNMLHVDSVGGHHIVFQRTVTSWDNQPPDNITMVNLLVEDQFNDLTAKGCLRVDAAGDLSFISSHWNAPIMTDNTKSAMVIYEGDIEFSGWTAFNGHSRTMEAFMRVDDGALVALSGRLAFINSPYGIRKETGGHVRINPTHLSTGGTAALFHPSGTGDLTNDPIMMWSGLDVRQKLAMFGGTGSGQFAAIANPTGGTVIDVEARAALASLLAKLRTRGDLAP